MAGIEHAGPSRCPLCGGPNACVYGIGDAARGKRCWCEDVSIAPEVLAAVPIEQVGRACVCAACVSGSPSAGTNADSSDRRER